MPWHKFYYKGLHERTKCINFKFIQYKMLSKVQVERLDLHTRVFEKRRKKPWIRGLLGIRFGDGKMQCFFFFFSGCFYILKDEQDRVNS